MNTLKTPAYKYLLSKAVFNYGIPTTVLCGIIYFFISRVDMPIINIASDLYISVFVTCFICSLTMIPSLKGDFKKGKMPDLSGNMRPLYGFIPKNLVLHSVLLSLISTVLYAFIPGGIAALVNTFAPDAVIAGNLYWILKSLYSGVFISLHIYKSAACAALNLQTNK